MINTLVIGSAFVSGFTLGPSLDSLAHDAASPLNPFGLASLFGLVAAIGCYLQNKMRYKNFTDGISSFAVPFFTITA